MFKNCSLFSKEFFTINLTLPDLISDIKIYETLIIEPVYFLICFKP